MGNIAHNLAELGGQDKVVSFATTRMAAGGVCSQHTLERGGFTYSFSAVLEVKNLGEHFMVPPDTAHPDKTRYEPGLSSFYIHQELGGHLSKTTCVLSVNPLLRFILEHLRCQPDLLPESESNLRLLMVLVDRLSFAGCASTYLPFSDDPLPASAH